jgi:hypothetical protein
MPLSPSRSYADWKKTIARHQFHTEEFISFDLASYFNGVYHHDLQAWFDGFPARLAQGLESATDDQLAAVEILGDGYGLHWEALDADISIPGLLAGIFGTRAHMARLAGRATSSAKAAAARANGARGGRPRKAAPSGARASSPQEPSR